MSHMSVRWHDRDENHQPFCSTLTSPRLLVSCNWVLKQRFFLDISLEELTNKCVVGVCMFMSPYKGTVCLSGEWLWHIEPSRARYLWSYRKDWRFMKTICENSHGILLTTIHIAVLCEWSILYLQMSCSNAARTPPGIKLTYNPARTTGLIILLL